MTYDAIVVGARCAGSPTAMLLARKGHRVLLVDRATFPSDTLSTHWLQQTGLARMQRWGLLERLERTSAPPIESLTLDFGPFAITGTPPPAGDVRHSYCARRIVLDQLLVDAAVEAGAELREGFTVDELLWEDGKVAGLRGHERGGRQVTERAPIVIGADGLHSVVARAVKPRTYNEIESRTCVYYGYWSGLDFGRNVVTRARDGLGVVTFPTNDGLTLVLVGRRAAEFPTVRRDVGGWFDRGLAEVGILDEVAAGTRETKIFGTADFQNVFRVPYGPGWALVGDAGYHKDSITAQGISDAFRDADLVSEAVHAGLTGRRDMQDALAEFQAVRDEASLPMYGFTTELARQDAPGPEQVALFEALAASPEHANRFVGVFAGTVPVQEFFSPENLGAILAAA